MGYKLVVECDLCGVETKIPAYRGRRGSWLPSDGTYVTADFNLLKDGEGRIGDGPGEICVDTVCKPCRERLREAFMRELAQLKKKRRK